MVILDLKMPGLGGIEILRNIKHRHPLVEVIMLSDHGSAESAVKGLELGAFDYVTKPCGISVLIGKITDAKNNRQSVEEKIRRTKTDEIISHPLAMFDRKGE